MNVREGFETIFKFRIAEGSLRCNQMDDVYTNCRARGGDGIARDTAAESEALGAGGAGLECRVSNSLAIEFDTYYNAELLEPYENHIAVHTRGWRHSSVRTILMHLHRVQVQDVTRDNTARIL